MRINAARGEVVAVHIHPPPVVLRAGVPAPVHPDGASPLPPGKRSQYVAFDVRRQRWGNRLVTGVCENGAFQMKTWRKAGDALVPVGRRDSFVPPSAVPRLAARLPCADFQIEDGDALAPSRSAHDTHKLRTPVTKGARQIFLQSAILLGFTCVVPRAQGNGV